MAWLADVDPLKLHNFNLGADSTIFKHDESKADRKALCLAHHVGPHPSSP